MEFTKYLSLQFHQLNYLLTFKYSYNPKKSRLKHMIIQKPVEKNDVITVKLLTGEEIIGRFEADDDQGLHVSRASVVAANPEGGLGLVPWMMSSAPEKICINKNTVVTYSPTVEQIADKFTEATSSIQVVK